MNIITADRPQMFTDCTQEARNMSRIQGGEGVIDEAGPKTEGRKEPRAQVEKERGSCPLV